MTDTPSRPVDERVETALDGWCEALFVGTDWRNLGSADRLRDLMCSALARSDVWTAQHPKPVTREMAIMLWQRLPSHTLSIDDIPAIQSALAGITTSARKDEALKIEAVGSACEHGLPDDQCERCAEAVLFEQLEDKARQLEAERDDVLAKLKEAEAAGRVLTSQLEKALTDHDEWKARAEDMEDERDNALAKCERLVANDRHLQTRLSETEARAETAEGEVKGLLGRKEIFEASFAEVEMRLKEAEAKLARWGDDYNEVLGQRNEARNKLKEAEDLGGVNNALARKVAQLRSECDEWRETSAIWSQRAYALGYDPTAPIRPAQHQAPDVGVECTEEDLEAFRKAYCRGYDSLGWAGGITAVLQRRQALGAAQQGEPSDEQLRRAVRAYDACWDNTESVDDCMRAALRAAHITAPAVEGEKAEPEEEEEDEGAFIQRAGTDATAWAAEFNRTLGRLYHHTVDEGWLIGWFANAIEAGRRVASPGPSPDPLPVEQIAAVPDVPAAVRALIEVWSGLERLLFPSGRVALDRAKQAMGDDHARAALDKLRSAEK